MWGWCWRAAEEHECGADDVALMAQRAGLSARLSGQQTQLGSSIQTACAMLPSAPCSPEAGMRRGGGSPRLLPQLSRPPPHLDAHTHMLHIQTF